MWIKIADTNLEEGKWYKTALQHSGKYDVIQKLKPKNLYQIAQKQFGTLILYEVQ